MKVLHVLETSLPHVVGYTVRASAILDNQRKLGIDVVAVTSPLFPSDDNSIAHENIDGVRYYRTNSIAPPATARTKAGSYLRRLLMLIRYRKAVLDIARREDVDVIHAHSSYTNAFAALHAARRLGLPVIYEVRTLWGESAVVEDGWQPASWRYRAIWRLELEAMRRVDAVVPIAEGIREELVRRGLPDDKLTVIPNGVDSDRFQPMPRDEQQARSAGLAGRFVIGFVGSIRRLEGLQTLLDAHRICRERGIETGIVVVGDGPDKPNLEEFASRHGLSDVRFTGHVSPAEVARWYSIMDVVAYPRIRAVISERVTPLKPLEAMSMAKVCVGSDVGGLTELISDGETGMIFRAEDAESLADVIERLSEDADLAERLQRNALDYVRRERQWSVIAAKYQRLYTALIGGPSVSSQRRDNTAG